MSNPRKFLTPEESDRLAHAVRDAESRTSAEIKVSIICHCWGDIRRKAGKVFTKLGLHQTQERNCVMIMLVLANREFLIYGDVGIHEKVGQAFWDDVRDLMRTEFREGRFLDGLCGAVQRAGEKLADHFPRRVDDQDEISDEVAYED